MRRLLLCMGLVACGSDVRKMPGDAQPPQDDGAGSAAPDCNTYCNAIDAACTGAVQQYDSVQNCLDSCPHFIVGVPGATTFNTLACRMSHTEEAKTDPAAHCVHAGPSGGGMCGASICDGFCAIAIVECPTQWPIIGCATQCAGVRSTPPYSTTSAGNTIECRLHQLTRAATDPTTFCKQTSATNSMSCR